MSRFKAFLLASAAGIVGMNGSGLLDHDQIASAQAPAANAVVAGRQFAARDLPPTVDKSTSANLDQVTVPRLPDHASEGPQGGRVAIMPSNKPTQVKMSGVERIRLRAWSSPEMNGEYSVDPDYTLSIPGLGRIQVGDMTPADLEVVLSERLSETAHRDVKISVEVLRSRPFFIMGRVGQAGAFEWRPGLNVIQAVSLAGGVIRSEAPGEQALNSQQARTRLVYAKAQLARLRAEKFDQSTVATGDLSAAPAVAGKGKALSRYATAQNNMLDQQRAVLQNRIANLESDRLSAQREYESATRQAALIKNQLNLVHASARDLEGLRQKRLISSRTYVAQQTEVVNMEGKYAEIQVMAERAKLRVETLARQVTIATQERQTQLNDHIEALEQEIEVLQPGSVADGSVMPEVRSTALEFFIARNADGHVQTKGVTVFSDVLPGDVVIVSPHAQTFNVADVPKGASREAELASAVELTQRVLEASSPQGPGNLKTPVAPPQ